MLAPHQINYRQLAAEMLQQAAVNGTAYKDVVSSTPTSIYGHGPGGTFSSQGLSQQVFNAMILPHLGLEGRLPYRTSNETDPLFGILTGVTATTGSNPVGECDDPKTAGLAKLCTHSAPFGRLSLQTRVFELEHFGERTNRGEFIDLNLIGNPMLEPGAGRSYPTVPGGMSAANSLKQEAAKAMFEFAASWAREFAHICYDGNPSNNTAGGGYREPYGLDALVNTGYQDAETQSPCGAADSIVESFANQNITSASADIVGKVQDIFFRLRHIATRAGLGAVKWVMSMPYGLFYRLSEVWAYYYYSRALDSLTFNAALQVNIGGSDAVQMRDSFRGNLESRTGQFLMIDGQRIDVILDDAIAETEISPGVFSSDIYILPMTVRAGTPVLYKEYYNYNTPGGAMEGARMLAPGDSYYVTDGGAYFWHKKPPNNYCVQVMTVTKSRIILRTPYIAARITDVAWAPLTEHERSPFTDSAYFADGGNYDRLGYGPSYWPPTS